MIGRRTYLVDGVSGSGKTAVCTELLRRGHHAIHGDRELAYQGDPRTGTPVTGVTGVAVHDHHLWRVDAVREIAQDTSHPVTYLCGGARNWPAFVDLLDGVLVLTVDAATLSRRLDARPADEWAGSGRHAERALVEELHRTGDGLPNGIAIDAAGPLVEVVDTVLRVTAGD